MNLLIPILLSLIVLPLCGLGVQPLPGSHWHPASWNQEGQPACAQPAAEQAAILRKAQTEKYSLRRLEFIGNADTNDGTLRRRIALKEGNVFSRVILIKSLKSLNKLRTIHPVGLSDVLAHMDEQEKTIDLVICIREKKRRVSRHQTIANCQTFAPKGFFHGIVGNDNRQVKFEKKQSSFVIR